MNESRFLFILLLCLVFNSFFHENGSNCNSLYSHSKMRIEPTPNFYENGAGIMRHQIYQKWHTEEKYGFFKNVLTKDSKCVNISLPTN